MCPSSMMFVGANESDAQPANPSLWTTTVFPDSVPANQALLTEHWRYNPNHTKIEQDYKPRTTFCVKYGLPIETQNIRTLLSIQKLAQFCKSFSDYILLLFAISEFRRAAIKILCLNRQGKLSEQGGQSSIFHLHEGPRCIFRMEDKELTVIQIYSLPKSPNGTRRTRFPTDLVGYSAL